MLNNTRIWLLVCDFDTFPIALCAQDEISVTSSTITVKITPTIRHEMACCKGVDAKAVP